MYNHLALSVKKKIFVIFIAIILGLLITFSPGSLFILILSLLFILMIRFFSEEPERGFLTRILILGMVLRVILLLSIMFILILLNRWSYNYYGVSLPFIFQDSSYYVSRSWAITQFGFKIPLGRLNTAAILEPYGFNSYLYVMSVFHYLCGFSPISVTFINSLLSVLTGILYYFIAREIADKRSARITAFLIVFFPSSLLWSITNLKDASFSFLTALVFWAFIKLLRTNKVRYLILSVFTLAVQSSMRSGFFLFSLFLIGLSYFLIRGKNKRIYFFILLVILLIFFPMLKNSFDILKYQVINYHRGVISSGGFTYRLYDDWVYKPWVNFGALSNFALAKGLIKGWLHFFLEPFPWKMSFSIFRLLSFPQVIIWYFLLLFSVFGILLQLKHDWRKNLVFIIYLLGIGTSLSLTGGNIGTDFRMRDMLTPTIVLFSSIGIGKIFYFKKPNGLVNQDKQ